MKSSRGEINKKLKKILKFLILFNLFSIPLYLFIIFSINIEPLQVLTASEVNNVLHIAGVPSQLTGTEITVPMQELTFTGSIDWDCTGWKSILAFMALIFATDASLGKKLRGLVFIPVIYCINIFRVSVVFLYVSRYGLSYYEAVHSFLFGAFMIMIILSLWIVWLKYFNFPEKKIVSKKS